MARLAETAVTVFMILVTSATYIVSIYGTYAETESTKWMVQYIAPSAVFNIIIVTYLLYLIISKQPYKAGFTTFFAVFLLLGGVLLETYVTILFYELPNNIATYVVLTLNYLIRLFYLIDLRTMLCPPAVASAIAKAVSGTPATPSIGLEDLKKSLQEKWNELKKQADAIAAAAGKTVSGPTKGEGQNIINAAKGDVGLNETKIKEALKSAADKLRDVDGNTIPGLKIGGRRR